MFSFLFRSHATCLAIIIRVCQFLMILIQQHTKSPAEFQKFLITSIRSSMNNFSVPQHLYKCIYRYSLKMIRRYILNIIHLYILNSLTVIPLVRRETYMASLERSFSHLTGMERKSDCQYRIQTKRKYHITQENHQSFQE